jgi:DNA mismatch repair protein MSH6
VALDELGRGTATMDGVAIASAVVTQVVDKIQCRGIFATHYHVLADDFAGNSGVSVKHMACDVDRPENGGIPKAGLHAAGLRPLFSWVATFVKSRIVARFS